jgi:hypothetical protein
VDGGKRSSNLRFEREIVDGTAAFLLGTSQQCDLLFESSLEDSDGFVAGTKLAFVGVLERFQLLGRIIEGKFRKINEN